jgi:hypothetical protein
MSVNRNIQFSPGFPILEPFDVQNRLQVLREYLNPNSPNYQPQNQHVNIKATIKLYEDGKIDGIEQVFIMDGKVVSWEDMFKGTSWTWSEGRFCQF